MTNNEFFDSMGMDSQQTYNGPEQFGTSLTKITLEKEVFIEYSNTTDHPESKTVWIAIGVERKGISRAECALAWWSILKKH